MNTELKHYIETQILPNAGIVEDGAEPFTDLKEFIHWMQAVLRRQMEITTDSLMEYLMTDSGPLIQKKRNFYLYYKEFDNLALPLQGTEAQGNFHKMLIAVIVLPCDMLNDGEFYFLTDDEFEILKAVENDNA
jgi:hypothetical protein